MSIAQFRRVYHQMIYQRLLCGHEPNATSAVAESDEPISDTIVSALVERLISVPNRERPTGHAADCLFTELTLVFLQDTLALLKHIRTCKWQISTNGDLLFDQYEYVTKLQRLLYAEPELRAALGGDYLITPDITIGRYPATDAEINQDVIVVGDAASVCQYSPLRATNRPASSLILHATISCKWTMRSDRAQNIRTEGLNLIRNRKGHLPHIAAATAEPLPSRLASLALGTGDLDCVYHFALPELQQAVTTVGNSDQLEMLTAMIEGRRLRDISDLPLDLAV